ncbi:hypothetical protein PAPYR_7063 [Paratrimastix pyriformis]|uniref:Profilin n=1 Tax=Paratrimastix pyriformis TaxID=342808 RepID=A0ABQ8UHU8_9EUKA|nr:hypothetical protein PAPYR_7063 [Paratrimastix pyriformis]|eukprot:GAFH01005412.1.p1 GENE.GAFH01005412.1~~GAFH01005412.1.p1  ORF type:complete len:147 (-),score=42.30 GAFH01005412.1:178-618(-)
MAWDPHVQLNFPPTDARWHVALVGNDGVTWGSTNFTLSQQDGANIAAIFAAEERQAELNVGGGAQTYITRYPKAFQTGIVIGDKKYMASTAENGALYGRKGADGVCVLRLSGGTGFVVATHDAGLHPILLNQHLGEFIDYLKKMGY